MGVGSTFIHAVDRSQLLRIAHDMDAVDDLPHVDLQVLNALDFCVKFGGSKLYEGEPVVYDEGSGLAIVKISPKGLATVLRASAASDLMSEEQADLQALRAFVDIHGAHTLYELSTF